MNEKPNLDAEMAFLAHQRELKAAKHAHHSARVTTANQARAGAKEKVGRIETAWREDRLFKIWVMRCSGYGINEIAQELDISAEDASKRIWDAHEAHRKRMGEVIEVYRDMELTRSDMLLKRWLGVSMMDAVTVERLEHGEPVTKESIEVPLKAAYVVLEIMKFRARLLGLNAADKAQQEQDPRDLLAWLQTQVNVVEKMVAEQPRELVLQTDNDIDGANNGFSQVY